MIESPIIMQPESVRGIMADRKTQTRRVVTDAHHRIVPSDRAIVEGVYPNGWKAWYAQWPHDRGHQRACDPPGRIGDRLWVKEGFCPRYFDDGRPGYRADYDPERVGDVVPEPKWKPSIYMPRALSRLTLEVTGVRVERVQGISDDDAIAEGVQKSACGLWCGRPHRAHGMPTQHNTPREAFASIWDHINGKRAPWASKPWVWVVEFRRVI